MALHCEEARAKQMTMNAAEMRDVWKLMGQKGNKDHLRVALINEGTGPFLCYCLGSRMRGHGCVCRRK
jgi:hypothetical protein